MPFKGQSARGGKRPGAGRKPKPFTILKRQMIAQGIEDAEYAYSFLVSIMRHDAQSLELRKECALHVLDRVIGKPKQSIDIRDWREEARRLRAEGKLTREALMAEREALIAELDSLADEFFGQRTEEVQTVNDDNDR